jgi:hypothetical protein
MTHFLVQFAEKLDPDALNVVQLTGDQVLQNGLNLAYFVLAIIAVVVVIVAGIMYATSGGDSAAVTKAKNLILYSVVGIVVIAAAWAITNFVIGRF